jgi:DNA-binding beta-propeller fold protein YncE
VYVANFADNGDAGNVMKIDPAGNKTLMANVNSPSDVAVGADGSLYVTSHFTSTLSHISPTGSVIPITQDLEAARNVISVPEPGPAAIMILLATSLFHRKRR